MLNNLIKSKINQLWAKFWAGGIANPLTAMEQISYLLFMCRLDVIDRKRRKDANLLGHTYDSPFANKDNCRWSNFRNLPASQMLPHIRENVFEFIKTLQGEESLFTKHMKDAIFFIPKESLLVEAVNIIDGIYGEIERQRQEEGQTFHDTQGDIYEHLLSEIRSSGKNGQFRTPRHIIQMVVAMVNPTLGDEIVDPAAGTGGFLLGAYQQILTNNTSEAQQFTDENGMVRGLSGDKLTDEHQWEVLREHTLYGFDIDQTMVRIGLMNLLLHGIDRPNFQYTDTLSKLYNETGRYDVALANPPFKGSIDKGDINKSLSLATTKTELLFVNRIINLLRIGGRAGVIVPDGVLFGSSKAHVALRKMLIEDCELQGVLSMPPGVFKPYAGVSTSVIFFVKGGQTGHVWFYDMQADGYSLNNKRNKIDANDIPDIIKQWRERDPTIKSNRKAKSFFVPKADIIANKYDLLINLYKEIEYEEVVYEAPTVIIAKLRALEADIISDLDALEGMLG